MAANGILRAARSPDGRIYTSHPDGDKPALAPLNFVEYVGFIHSLFRHTGAIGQGPATDFTQTGNWLGWFAGQSGTQGFGATFFGQIDGHNSDWASRPGPPTVAQDTHTFDTTPAWPSGTFAEQDFTHCFITPPNFVQTTEPASNYSSQFATLINNVLSEEPNITFVNYIAWAEPGLSGPVVDAANLTPTELTAYIAYHAYNSGSQSVGAYLNWHIQLQDEIIEAVPGVSLLSIPVGVIIFEAMRDESYMSTVTWQNLTVDGAPHGSDTMYFLAGLICYIALYRQLPTITASSPWPATSAVVSQVRDNIVPLMAFIQSRLSFYNESAQNVRVYP